MKLKDLENGMQIEIAAGGRYLVFTNQHTAHYGMQKKLFVNILDEDEFLISNHYNEDMTIVDSLNTPHFNINKVYKGKGFNSLKSLISPLPEKCLIWEREKSYEQFQNEAGFEVGDFVIISERYKSKEIKFNWSLNWVAQMDANLGHYGKITNIHPMGIVVQTSKYDPIHTYPFFSLRKE